MLSVVEEIEVLKKYYEDALSSDGWTLDSFSPQQYGYQGSAYARIAKKGRAKVIVNVVPSELPTLTPSVISFRFDSPRQK